MNFLDYFKAELLRFRGWAAAFFFLHLAVLGFLTRVVDLAQQPLFIYQAFAGVYLACGVLLGAYQMGNYRKPNAWLNLLHRPIAHHRLALALMAAAALLLAAGVLAPTLLIAAAQEWLSPRVLDLRHLGLALSGWLLAVCGYLIGAFAMLANRRYAAMPRRTAWRRWRCNWGRWSCWPPACWPASSPTWRRRHARWPEPRRWQPCCRWRCGSPWCWVRSASNCSGSCRAAIRTIRPCSFPAARRKPTTPKVAM